MWHKLLISNSSAVLSVALQLFVHIDYGYSLRCYSCSMNFHENYDENTRDKLCADKAFLLLGEDDTVRNCAPWETSCVTTVLAVNTAIAAVSRGCVEDCSECEVSGFGNEQVNCDDCCEEDLCNGNFSKRYFDEVLKRQHSSYITPVDGEAEFNARNKIKFPRKWYGNSQSKRQSFIHVLILIVSTYYTLYQLYYLYLSTHCFESSLIL